MSRILFVAPASNLALPAEILAAVQGQAATICAGNVDRAKLEQYLYTTQYDVIHFMGHGNQSVLQLSDGLLEVADLLIMLERQHRLQLIVVTACLSMRVATEIHNARGIPAVACQIEIDDDAAVRFSETFYRAWLATGDVTRATNVGRATLAKEFPAMADAVVVVNGAGSPPEELAELMAIMRSELASLRGVLENLKGRVEHLEGELAVSLPQPTTWHVWFNMVFSLVASVLLILVLLRSA